MSAEQSRNRDIIEPPKPSRAIPSLAALSMLCLVALPASANAGTAFMFFGMLYVLFANVLIGLFEGGLVKLLFRDMKAIVLLPLFIAANYASMFAGMTLTGVVRGRFVACLDAQSLLFQAPKIMVWLAVASFVVTIVVEWPFCWLAIRMRRRAWAKALLLSLALQTVSYVPIGAWWYKVSSFDMYTNCTLVADTEFTQNPGFTVYALDDESLWRMNLDGTDRTRVADAPEGIRPYALSLRAEGEVVRLVAVGRTLHGEGEPYEEIAKEFAELALDANAMAGMEAPPFDYSENLHAPMGRDETRDAFHWEFHWVGVDYRLPAQRSWSALRHPFGYGNPDVVRVKAYGKRFTVGLETPFLSFGQGPLFLLPNGEFTAKLGGEIVLVDVNSRTIGTLAEADAYLVLPDEAHATRLLEALEQEREAEEASEEPAADGSSPQ